jgi:ABC-type transporter lipoprotein component MlaA
VETTTYKRKPIYVEAVKVTEENFTEVAAWCQGAIVAKHGMTLGNLAQDSSKHIKVRVVNPQKPRQTKAFVGDWVLYSEYHGYKVYTETAFRNAFELPTGTESDAAVQAAKQQPENVPDGTYGGAREVPAS